MKGKILVVEDDPDVRLLLRYNLEREGFEVVSSETGADAVDLCLTQNPDVVLLDIVLPAGDGIEICRQIRHNPLLYKLPVIFLSAKAEEADRVLGLEVGGTDYVVKPFFVRELLARIKKQLARDHLQMVPGNGDFHIDRGGRCARSGRALVELSATEFRLLDFFVSHPGVVFSRQELLVHAWQGNTGVTERTVDVYVLRLRQRLEGVRGGGSIRSVRGMGYRFDPDEPGASR
ncbi:MAG: response regulator transcription factor [Bryobacteraceae bacterium]